MIRCLVVDPIIDFEIDGEHSHVPWDARNDDVLACSISDVGFHF